MSASTRKQRRLAREERKAKAQTVRRMRRVLEKAPQTLTWASPPIRYWLTEQL